LDDDGDIIWNQKFDFDSKNGSDIIETTDKFILVGSMKDRKPWIAKIDTIRDIISYTLKSSKIQVQNISNLNSFNSNTNGINSNIQCFPNPFDEKLIIKTNYDEWIYYLYDIKGKLVNHNTVHSKQLEMNTSDLQSGIYQFMVIYDNKSYSVKLVKK
jgi:hypothetical protein